MSGGRKVQHRIRRGRRPPDLGTLVPITYREPNPALGYRPDGSPRTEAVRVCRVRIFSVLPSTVREATGMDARAEGYPSLAALLEDWPEPRAAVWVICWAVHVEEVPRFLSREVVAGHQGDYTEVHARGLHGELEAVDDATLDRFTRAAREREREAEVERRRILGELPFEAEVSALAAEARARHIDVRDELRAIRRWRDPAARRRQLRLLRAKLAPESDVASGGFG